MPQSATFATAKCHLLKPLACLAYCQQAIRTVPMRGLAKKNGGTCAPCRAVTQYVKWLYDMMKRPMT